MRAKSNVPLPATACPAEAHPVEAAPKKQAPYAPTRRVKSRRLTAKYTDPNGARLLIPAPITAEQRTEVQAMAERAYTALDCSGLARVDFFIDKKSGKLYLNEINTMPGFTPISMFPKMCEQSGLPSDRLIELLLEQGLDRFKKRRVLKTSFT